MKVTYHSTLHDGAEGERVSMCGSQHGGRVPTAILAAQIRAIRHQRLHQQTNFQYFQTLFSLLDVICFTIISSEQSQPDYLNIHAKIVRSKVWDFFVKLRRSAVSRFCNHLIHYDTKYQRQRHGGRRIRRLKYKRTICIHTCIHASCPLMEAICTGVHPCGVVTVVSAPCHNNQCKHWNSTQDLLVYFISPDPDNGSGMRK